MPQDRKTAGHAGALPLAPRARTAAHGGRDGCEVAQRHGQAARAAAAQGFQRARRKVARLGRANGADACPSPRS